MAKAKEGSKRQFIVARGYWDDDGNKVQKGEGVEMTADDAMDMVDAGILRAVK